MKKILFVCHGNICRSPMAEFYFRRLVERAGLSSQVRVSSAATSDEEVGNPIYPLAKRMLAEKGIGCKDKTARQMTRNDYRNYNYIVVMDRNNIQNLEQLTHNDKNQKISLLLSYVDPEDTANYNRDVADPWYTRRFDKAFADIELGCKALLKYIQQELAEEQELAEKTTE